MTDEPLDDSTEPATSSTGPLLPPEDRIWRHPSELTASFADSPAPSGGRGWGAAAFSAVGGALAVGALWLAVGNGDERLVTERVSLAPIHTVSPRVVEADEWGRLVTAGARRGTVSVLSSSNEIAIAAAFAYRDDGYLLTSARAVQGQESLMVIDSNGVAHEARMIGTDPRTDVSVLHIETGTDSAIVAGGEPLELGDTLALVGVGGSSLESTVTDTTSHVSTADGDTVLGVVTLDSELGEIPPGSPAVDDTGAIVGMTTATDPGTNAALVPIDIARQVAGELIDDGVASHSWVGVTARDLSADEIDGDHPDGALVVSLTADGPAAAAEMMPGDVIVQVGSKAIDSVSAMVTALRYHEPGDDVAITVVRDGEAVSLVVELGTVDSTVSTDG